MRASPYDFSGLGYEPVRVETVEGKQVYAEAQRRFAERGAPLRQRLVDECERLLQVGQSSPGASPGSATARGDPAAPSGR